MHMLGKNVRTYVRKTGCEVLDLIELSQDCLMAGLWEHFGSSQGLSLSAE
jgi:hypothetical protein